MNGIQRLNAAFEKRAAQGRKVLVPYLTGGDPDILVTETLMDASAVAGADIIELGIPFSDPMADGPVLQEAAERALANGADLPSLIAAVGRFGTRHDTPVVLFGYYNPFFRYGHEALARDAAAAGACGVLCVDLPPEEAGPFREALNAEGLALIPLVTPVSGPDRIAAARDCADSFVYYVSATGVTGLSLDGRGSIAERVAEVRAALDRPLVVGFGVRTPEDAARMAEGADGVVVGTAIVRLAHEAPPDERVPALESFVEALRAAV